MARVGKRLRSAMHHLGLVAPAVPSFIAWQCAYGGGRAVVSAPESLQPLWFRSRPLLGLRQAGAPKRAFVNAKVALRPRPLRSAPWARGRLGDYVVFACGRPAARAQSGCVRTSNNRWRGP
jgi:hypothetical protein